VADLGIVPEIFPGGLIMPNVRKAKTERKGSHRFATQLAHFSSGARAEGFSEIPGDVLGVIGSASWGPLRQARRTQEPELPVHAGKAERFQSFLEWLKTFTGGLSKKHGKISEHALCYHLGKEILAVVDKASLEGAMTFPAAPSGWCSEVRPPVASPFPEEEDPQAFEDRIFRALWQEYADEGSPMIEEGGRLEPDSLVQWILEEEGEGDWRHMSGDHWFTMVTDDRLQQGDLLAECSLIVPKRDLRPALVQSRHSTSTRTPSRETLLNAYRVEIKIADVVVLTQSCDLENEKADLVVVCPIYSLEEVFRKIRKDPGLSETPADKIIGKVQSVAQSIRGGRTVGRYMLGPCTLKKWQRGVRIVDFDKMISVPYAYLKTEAAKQRNRLRIKSPYREALAQAFAQFFMRVALDAPVTSDVVNKEIEDLRKTITSPS
jgi:hypothetical protein